jgi:regulator of RNase E activity RraA
VIVADRDGVLVVPRSLAGELADPSSSRNNSKHL